LSNFVEKLACRFSFVDEHLSVKLGRVGGWQSKFVKDLLEISFQSLCSVHLGGFIAPNRVV